MAKKTKRETQETIAKKETLTKTITEYINKLDERVKEVYDILDSREFEYGDSSLVDLTLHFMKNFSKWKYNEGMWVNLAIEELEKNKKDKKTTIKCRLLDTINIFLQRIEGSGAFVWDASRSSVAIDFAFTDYIKLFQSVQKTLLATNTYRTELQFLIGADKDGYRSSFKFALETLQKSVEVDSAYQLDFDLEQTIEDVIAAGKESKLIPPDWRLDLDLSVTDETKALKS